MVGEIEYVTDVNPDGITSWSLKYEGKESHVPKSNEFEKCFSQLEDVLKTVFGDHVEVISATL
jgi:hypothetical protein